MGIHVEVPQDDEIDQQYAEVIVQLQRLNPEQLTVFERIKETFVNDEREHEAIEKEEERKAKEAAEERAAMLANLSAAH